MFKHYEVGIFFHYQPTIGSQVSSQTLNDIFKYIDNFHATNSTQWQITTL
jgi:hypothetical protein